MTDAQAAKLDELLSDLRDRQNRVEDALIVLGKSIREQIERRHQETGAIVKLLQTLSTNVSKLTHNPDADEPWRQSLKDDPDED